MYSFYMSDYEPAPQEVVRDVARMMGMLATLVGKGGTEYFNDDDNHGLSVLLSGFDHLLNEAADETTDTIQSLKNDPGIQYREVAMTHATKIVEEQQSGKTATTAVQPEETAVRTAGTYPKVPELTAKQQMVASTYRHGYDVKEIAKAVNLKAASVENMIQQLKEQGVLDAPPEGDELSQAVNG